MGKTHTSSNKLRVRYQETDRMGIVYHSNYLIWFEIGRTELFRKIGVSYSELEKDGYYLVVTEANCQYRVPATYDDELEILTRLTELKNTTLTFNYEVRKGGTLITSGMTKHAFIDANGKIVRIPAILTEALSKEVKNG
jgi:acyl-CoA thioester hydrolase